MTTVKCIREQCRSWLNGRCKRTKIRIVGMNCTDFVARRGSFRNVTTTVYCDNKETRNRGGCSFNRNGQCTKPELTIRGDGCKPSDVKELLRRG